MNASVFCTDVGVLLGLAEVHSDRVHGAGEPWGGAEARSKILRVWVGSGVLEGGHMKVVDGTECTNTRTARGKSRFATVWPAESGAGVESEAGAKSGAGVESEEEGQEEEEIP